MNLLYYYGRGQDVVPTSTAMLFTFFLFWRPYPKKYRINIIDTLALVVIILLEETTSKNPIENFCLRADYYHHILSHLCLRGKESVKIYIYHIDRAVDSQLFSLQNFGI